ncbi:MAG: hypothetical protein FGM32_08045 [Candidatus Kapabacteria bacterium]|nr:hypothetical protein [Candidatus Kapabacteria bacterium]
MNQRLTALGLPDILDNPEELAQLTDEQIDELANIRDEAAEALESDESNSDLIDTVYLAHMTLSSALFLRAIASDVEIPDLPAAQVLARSWGGSLLLACEADTVRDIIAPRSTLDVLTKAGLPATADPELTFSLPPTRLSDMIELAEDDVDDASSKEFFSTFWKIGETDDGDVLCLDERADCAVILLDAEWGYYAQQFVNSSVGHLLQCLEAWRLLEEDDANEVDEAIERFERAVDRIDPRALTEGAFWSDVVAMLEEEEDEE